MRKRDELTVQTSCLNVAYPDEMLFILLARDPAAARAVREWVNERLRLGKNDGADAEIADALAIAQAMDDERAEIRARVATDRKARDNALELRNRCDELAADLEAGGWQTSADNLRKLANGIA